ncbi:hypothetical protein ACF0H5_003929 [Mactra antiquata]
MYCTTTNVKPHETFIIRYSKMNNDTVNTIKYCTECEEMKKIVINWWPGLFSKLFSLSTVAVLSSTANIFLMYIAGRTRSLVNNTKVFIISLCTAHLLGSIIVIPTWIITRLKPEFAMSSTVFCEVSSFFWILMILASFYSLSALSLDRYFIISNPMIYPIKATTNKKMIVVLLLWIFCIMFASSPFLGWGEYKFEPDAIPICGLNMKYSMSYTITLIVVGFSVPLMIDIFCCGRIISIARRQSRSIEARKGSDGSTSSSMSTRSTASTKSIQPLPKLSKLKQKINSLRLVFAGTGTFLACWLPYLGAHVWMTTIRNISHHRESMPYILEFVVLCIGLLNGLINPVVIMLTNRDYRKEIKSLLCKRFRNIDDRSDTDSINNNTQSRRNQFKNSNFSKAFNVLHENEPRTDENANDTTCPKRPEIDIQIDCVFDRMPPTPPAVDILGIHNFKSISVETVSERKRLMTRSTGSSSEIESSIDQINNSTVVKSDSLNSSINNSKSMFTEMVPQRKCLTRSTGSSSEMESTIDHSCKLTVLKPVSQMYLMKRCSTDSQLETMLPGVINSDETIK